MGARIGRAAKGFELGSFSKLQWMDAVRRCAEITAERRIVILHIGATAGPDGTDAWRSNQQVAAEVGVSVDTVARARRDGIKRGLWVETRSSRGGRGEAGRSAEYRLTMPEKGRTRADDLGEKGRTTAEKGPQESTEKGRTAAAPFGSSSVISSVDPWGPLNDEAKGNVDDIFARGA
ncbi:hypothetical protein MycrhDRAFT_1409 [Mycolicibacterium rhodesiae JS60]|nr:hypothetical protein MycrhDRAFT_1409 [Mycolicibacterium rhodesiae JS60]